MGLQTVSVHPTARSFARKPVHPVLSLVPVYTISGGLSGRPVLHEELPTYPAWAEEEGITGRVRLEFRVNDAGEVYPNIWVTQAVGHPEFEMLAINALKHWKFAPVKVPPMQIPSNDLLSEATPGQAGTINFTFSLTNHPIHL
jgi:TonB family protein